MSSESISRPLSVGKYTCTACGFRQSTLKYEPASEGMTFGFLSYAPHPPRLEVTCSRCGYVWHEATATEIDDGDDSDEEGGENEERGC